MCGMKERPSFVCLFAFACGYSFVPESFIEDKWKTEYAPVQ